MINGSKCLLEITTASALQISKPTGTPLSLLYYHMGVIILRTLLIADDERIIRGRGIAGSCNWRESLEINRALLAADREVYE